jgi:alpha-D-xyloside xylohydrolase
MGRKVITVLSVTLLLVIGRTYPYEKTGDGIRLQVRDSQERPIALKIKICSDHVVRITGSPSGSDVTPVSLMADDGQLPRTEFRIDEQGEDVRLITNKLVVAVSTLYGTVTFKNIDDETLLQEGPRQIVPANVCDEKVNHIQQSFKWTDDEALYGLGQHQEGIFNWRGHTAELFQHNRRAIIPFLLSTNGYGLLWDNYSFTRFSDTPYGSYIWSEVGDAIDYYFIYGPAPDTVIRNYRDLTGRSPLLPRWAYGYIQSKERYKTQQEILEVVKEYRDRKIPLDVIVLDWQYWDDGHWGQKSFNGQRFPDPQAMMRTLHEQYDTRLMISVWPKMSFRCADYQEMLRNGFLYPDDRSPFYDAFNPKARTLYWKQANEGLFSKGIDAWWCDATEPELDGWDFNTDAYKIKMKPMIGSGARYLNAYSLMHSKGIYENQRQTTDEKRVVNLTRSAFAGQQKYATITWSGDVVATWEVFRNQIPAGLNFCMSGLPYWTTDIGGFFVQSAEVGALGRGQWFRNGDYDNGIADDNYKELYVRWFQYGAFCPVFRSHGTDISREIWRFGEPGSWAFEALLRFDNLRYRLMPYIYSVASKVASEGYTLMRGLMMDFSHDPHGFDIADQFIFGPAILVNPVTKPGALFREVYLPRDSEWLNFWTGKKYSGGQTLSVPSPRDEIPLFVRAGSIIPMGPVIQYATEAADPIEIRIYPGADGLFIFYEDENDNYNYEKGICSTIEFNWNDKNSRLIIKERKGTFPNQLQIRTFHLVRVKEGRGTGVETVQSPEKTIRYDGNRTVITLN